MRNSSAQWAVVLAILVPLFSTADGKVAKHVALARRRSGRALLLREPTPGPPPWDKDGSKKPKEDVSPSDIQKGDVEVKVEQKPDPHNPPLPMPASPDHAAEAVEKPEQAGAIARQSWERAFTGMYIASTIVMMVGSFFFLVLCACAYSHYKVDASQPSDDGLEHHPALLDQGTWRFGLCDCFHDSHICLIGCCCPIIRWSDTMRMAGLMTFWHGVILMGVLYTLGTLTLGASLPIILCVFTYMRMQLRHVFSLNSDNLTCFEDCCTYLFCSPCAICQEARQLEETYAVAHPIAIRAMAESSPLMAQGQRREPARSSGHFESSKPAKPPAFENFPPPAPPPNPEQPLTPDTIAPMPQQMNQQMPPPPQSGFMQAPPSPMMNVPQGQYPPPGSQAQPQAQQQFMPSGSLPAPRPYAPPGSLPPPGQYPPSPQQPMYPMQSLPPGGVQYGAPMQYTSMPPPGQYAGTVSPGGSMTLPQGQYPPPGPGQYPPPGPQYQNTPPGSMQLPPGSMQMHPGSMQMPPGSMQLPPGSMSPTGSMQMPPPRQ